MLQEILSFERNRLLFDFASVMKQRTVSVNN